MDLVKSRLTGSSRASDISFLQVSMMNRIMAGKVYDWASMLAERMHEFMTLQHKTFYMPHYAIGLFLDAATRMILVDELEAKLGALAPGEPPIMQWKYLDTATGQKGSAGQKRPRMDTGGDTDSGRQETSSEEDSVGEEEGDEEDDEEVQVVTATPLLFSRTTVPVTPCLVPASLHMAHILGFGQTRRHGVRPSLVQPGVGFAVGFAQATTPVSQGTSSALVEALPAAAPVAPAVSQPAAHVAIAQLVEVVVAQPAARVPEAQSAVEVIIAQPAEVQAPLVESVPDTMPDGGEETPVEVADLPAPELAEGQSTSGVHLDVDMVVTVDATLLASPECDRESRIREVSTFLSMRFHRAPTPQMAYVQTPTRDDILEVDTQPQVAQPVPDIGPSHSTAEHMADAVEMVMGM